MTKTALYMKNVFQKIHEFFTWLFTKIFNGFVPIKKQPALNPSPQTSSEKQTDQEEIERQKQILAQEKEAVRQAQLAQAQEAAEKSAKEAQENAEKEARKNIEKLKLDAENNRVALYKAIVQGDVTLAKDCLSKTKSEEILANPSELLFKAIESGHLSIVKLLMQYGVRLEFDCHFKNHSAMTVALKARPPNIEIVKLLLSDPKISITRQMLYAAQSIRSEACRKMAYQPIRLFKNTETIFGCFLKARKWTLYPDKDQNELNCFLSAIEEGHVDTIKRTLNALDVKQTKIYMYSDLPRILYCPNDTPYLLARAAPVIELAIQHGQSELAQLLLQYYQTHKDILSSKKTDYNEHHIFYCALDYHDLEVAKLLIKSPHVNLNQKHKSVDPAALYYAASNQDHDLVDLLLEAGAKTFGLDLDPTGSKTDYEVRELQLKKINDFKKQITFLYNEKLKCLDSVIPEKGIKEIIRGYLDGLSFIESPSPN